MKNKKSYIIFILLLCISVLLVACKDDKGDEKEILESVKEYQTKIDFNTFYTTDTQRNIAKELIGKKAANFEGSFFNGSVFSLEKQSDKKYTVVKITNKSFISVEEDSLFKESKSKDVNFYTVLTDVKKDDTKGILESTGLGKDNQLFVIPENVKDIESYKAQYPPMYYVLDKNGYIALVLFDEQLNTNLTNLLNEFFELKLVDGITMTQEQLDIIEDSFKEFEKSVENGDFDEAEDYNQQIINQPYVEEKIEETVVEE